MLNHIKDLLRTGKEEIFWVQILHARTVLDTLQQKKDFHKMTYKQIGTTTKKVAPAPWYPKKIALSSLKTLNSN